jgi:murein DD-endopeptidase MepM/ murein hydrolase activator NlpD
VRQSSAERLFEGAFLQMRNSKVTSRFAEHRSYSLKGEKISEAIHYGYDLAVTQNAPIEAANRGRVLFADELGIYGNCVILDHGLGLTSLYGHLSQIDVEVGQLVEKGARLGRSGHTGLAGGDHLHFAMLVGETYVDPVEWWDAKWVREKIDEMGGPPPGVDAETAPVAAAR